MQNAGGIDPLDDTFDMQNDLLQQADAEKQVSQRDGEIDDPDGNRDGNRPAAFHEGVHGVQSSFDHHNDRKDKPHDQTQGQNNALQFFGIQARNRINANVSVFLNGIADSDIYQPDLPVSTHLLSPGNGYMEEIAADGVIGQDNEHKGQAEDRNILFNMA